MIGLRSAAEQLSPALVAESLVVLADVLDLEQVDHVAFGVVDAPRPVRVPGDVFLGEVVVAVTEYGGGKGGVVFGELLRGVD